MQRMLYRYACYALIVVAYFFGQYHAILFERYMGWGTMGKIVTRSIPIIVCYFAFFWIKDRFDAID